MKKILAKLAALVSLTPLVLFGQATATPDATVEQSLIKLENKWSDALVTRDAAFLEPLMADDYMETYPHGEFENKTQCLADLKAGDLHIASAVNDEYKAHLYGDAAVLNYRSTVRGNFKGADISGQYRVTSTWIKRAENWQCVAVHLSMLVE
jgi:ketosteroid isomerase-like protein